mgnify:CR=1 FL=1
MRTYYPLLRHTSTRRTRTATRIVAVPTRTGTTHRRLVGATSGKDAGWGVSCGFVSSVFSPSRITRSRKQAGVSCGFYVLVFWVWRPPEPPREFVCLLERGGSRAGTGLLACVFFFDVDRLPSDSRSEEPGEISGFAASLRPVRFRRRLERSRRRWPGRRGFRSQKQASELARFVLRVADQRLGFYRCTWSLDTSPS